MDAPYIEFPCDYPIKVIGDATVESVAEILAVVRRHAPEVTPDQVNTRQSSKGNYQSVRVRIVATGEQQLKALHADLMSISSVRMVL